MSAERAEGKNALRIGFLPQGGRDWIAGPIVLQNLVRSLKILPEQERPTMYVIVGPGHRIDEHSRGEWLPPSKHYTFGSGKSWASKLATTVRHHGLLRWPTSLERLSRNLNLSAVYPALTTLGPQFPDPWIGWIPDFQHKHLPQYFSEQDSHHRKEAFGRLVQEAPRVVVSSQDAYRDLMRWFPADPKKVRVLSFTTVADPEWYAADATAVASRLGLPRKYLMFPSQFWLHKNHRCVFQAIRILGHVFPDIALVCTGRMHDYRRPEYGDELIAETTRDGLNGRIHCLGLLDRHTQVQLMRNAVAIIQPSLFEGWSSLVEDARALGKRIYVSDIPIHREQDPPDAEFFDQASPDQLAALIARDWSHLAPGPDLVKEQHAFTAQRQRALDYARRFLSIVREISRSC
jgi:glycosyltransferase involved in cell wall biosynthesis